MNTYSQFLEARSLSEALLLKHAEEGTGRKGATQIVDRYFERLAKEMGYRIERMEPESAAVIDFRGEPAAITSARRPDMSRKLRERANA